MSCVHENAYKNVVSKTLSFWVCPDCGADLGSGEIPMDLKSGVPGVISDSNYQKTIGTGVTFPSNPEEGDTIFTDDSLYIFDGHFWYVLDEQSPDFRKLATLVGLKLASHYNNASGIRLAHQEWTDSQGKTMEWFLSGWCTISYTTITLSEPSQSLIQRKLEKLEQLVENIYGYTTEDKVFTAIEQYWKEEE